MNDECFARSDVDVRCVDDVHIDVPARQTSVRDHRPRAPGIVAMSAVEVHPEREDRPVVPAERAPAHVAGRVGPRNPRRTPAATRDPEPRPCREPPPAVVVRRPRPRIGSDPRPSPRPQRRPSSVIVRTPAWPDAWVPHVAVRQYPYCANVAEYDCTVSGRYCALTPSRESRRSSDHRSNESHAAELNT
jgi:hypothetical protein